MAPVSGERDSVARERAADRSHRRDARPGGGLTWLAMPAASGPASGPDRPAEQIHAGFAHDTGHGGPERARALGFEADGPADVLAPCSVLAELTGQARGQMAELTDDELVGVMQAARRVQSWQAALELQAVHELTVRRLSARPDEHQPGPPPCERAAAEIAAALTLTRPAAADWMNLAANIDRLDGVADALAAGQIDLTCAKVIAAELDLLDTLVANCLATSLMLVAPGLTAAQMRARCRSAVMSVDPDAIRRRQAKAQREARVEIWGETSGNAVLAGRELPAAGALAASRHLTALAQALKQAGAPGDLDQIRARVYLALLSGRDPATVLRPSTPAADTQSPPGPEHPASRASASSSGPDQPGGPDAASACARDSRDNLSADPPASAAAIAWPSGLRGTIHLTLPLSAWLGQTNRPGAVAGYGPADAWTCRFLASQLAGQPGTTYCLTVTTPEGQPVGHACTRTPPTSGSPAAEPSSAGSPPARSDPIADPASPHMPTAGPDPPPSKGPAPPPGLAATNPAPEPKPPAAGHTATSPLPATIRHWLDQLTIHWFNRQPDCDHALQTPAYRPGIKLGHLVKILNPSCTAPGCRRPASQSDLDHIQPHDQGGRTCTCNLHPACRHHHQMKQQPGWHVSMQRPGILTWQLPHGRSYTTIAEPYPI
jgi:hypothetical protein